jgi:hypothetical protein
VKVVGTDELTRQAARTMTVRRLIKLVEFVGDGRALTPRGFLKLADGKQLVELLETGDHVDAVLGDRVFKTRSAEKLPVLDYTFRLAKAMWLLDVEGSRLSPGPNAALVDGSPLPLVEMAVLTSLRYLGPTQHRWRHEIYGFGWYAEEFDRWLTHMLTGMARAQRAVPVDQLADEAWAFLEDVFDMSHFPDYVLPSEHWSVERSVRQALDLFVDHGIVAFNDEVRTQQHPYGFVERSGGNAKLTRLGRWVVRRFESR